MGEVDELKDRSFLKVSLLKNQPRKTKSGTLESKAISLATLAPKIF